MLSGSTDRRESQTKSTNPTTNRPRTHVREPVQASHEGQGHEDADGDVEEEGGKEDEDAEQELPPREVEAVERVVRPEYDLVGGRPSFIRRGGESIDRLRSKSAEATADCVISTHGRCTCVGANSTTHGMTKRTQM